MKRFVSFKALRSLDLVDALALSTLAVAAFFFWQPPTPWLRQGKIYVSPQGANWHTGATPGTAVRTIQRAADMAVPGEEIVILFGTYHEVLRLRRGGKPGQPIILRALEPGTVTITNADNTGMAEALKWRSEGDGIFSAVTPWPIYYARYRQAALYHVVWGGVARLRKLTALPGAWGAFAYIPEEQRLYIFQPDNQPLTVEDLVLHKAIPPPWEWGVSRVSNVWVEAEHVVLKDLRFDLGIGAGVLLWDGANTTIQDCWFSGASYGVTAQPQIAPATGLVLEYSGYDNYPQYHWRQDWLSWRQVYAHYSASSLVALNDTNLIVRHNLVAHAGDALHISPHSTENHNGAEVYGNLLIYGTDDAIQFDGQAQKVSFYNNLVYDFHQNLGLSPVLEGPVLIENNRFLHPTDSVNGSQLKFLNPWKTPLSYGPDLDPKSFHYEAIRNIQVFQNVFVGNWLAWWGDPTVKDVEIAENVFAVRLRKNPPWPPGVITTDNTIIQLPEGDYPNPGTNPDWWNGWSMPRPGPDWLDYADHPATRDIPKVLSPQLME